jgi:hypothetical protein
VNTAARTHLITLAVDTRSMHGDTDLVRSLLVSVTGVEEASADPSTARVWVFADGRIEAGSLVEVLASWGYGSYVLNSQLTVPQ